MTLIRTKEKIFTDELTYKKYEEEGTVYKFHIFKKDYSQAEESFDDSLKLINTEEFDQLFIDEKEGNAGKRSMSIFISKEGKVKVLNLDGAVFESYDFDSSDCIKPFFDLMDKKIKKTYRVKQNLEELKLLTAEEIEIKRISENEFEIKGYGSICVQYDKTEQEFLELKKALGEHYKIISNSNVSICYKSLNGSESHLFLFLNNRIAHVYLTNYKQLFKVRELLIKNGI